MARTAVISSIIGSGGSNVDVIVAWYEGSTSYGTDVISVDHKGIDSPEELMSRIYSAIDSFASSNSISIDKKVPMFLPWVADWNQSDPDALDFIKNKPEIPSVPEGLSEAPQAAVADAPTNAPADAVDDYNTVTTLLGALTGAVNAANAKQNQIAENANETAAALNSLLAKLRTVGIIES